MEKLIIESRVNQGGMSRQIPIPNNNKRDSKDERSTFLQVLNSTTKNEGHKKSQPDKELDDNRLKTTKDNDKKETENKKDCKVDKEVHEKSQEIVDKNKSSEKVELGRDEIPEVDHKVMDLKENLVELIEMLQNIKNGEEILLDNESKAFIENNPMLLNEAIATLEQLMTQLKGIDTTDTLLQGKENILQAIEFITKLHPITTDKVHKKLEETKELLSEIMVRPYRKEDHLTNKLNITRTERGAEHLKDASLKPNTNHQDLTRDNNSHSKEETSSKNELKPEDKMHSIHKTRIVTGFQQNLDKGIVVVNKENESIQSPSPTTKDTMIPINKDMLLNQVIEKMKLDINGGQTEIKIKLKPDILGEMSLKISIEKGIINAKAFVENHQVKELIEANLNQLKDQLKEQELNVQSFSVSVGKDNQFNNEQSTYRYRKHYKVKKSPNINVESSEGYLKSSNNEWNPYQIGESSIDMMA